MSAAPVTLAALTAATMMLTARSAGTIIRYLAIPIPLVVVTVADKKILVLPGVVRGVLLPMITIAPALAWIAELVVCVTELLLHMMIARTRIVVPKIAII
ncbi:MAG: hypothetical protein COY73_03270 [Candidatus Nealsonbacteria bacterium CG_4_10_14_0_8_um_filter_37_14]|uniref:Uncharacterized protein n=1 Tax=Candidatus Nealsonbacteria bacterium CG_4_10_14_0_8_um_filter_37_14 TaxID=1974684 RepID=A0A2M7R6U3_9BACT|nr:MAG: hypothetical protein COY73_03270 [Candidatus Nealsonbacteria bacterium CG_4_10_14_0_8_um_filter_37_14]